MPLIHISLRAGKPEAYREAIFDSLYRAMRETFGVPEDDQFMTITEHDASSFRYGASYYGIARSQDLLLIQVSAMNISHGRAEESAVSADGRATA